jgi:predicted transcriptional regulator
MRVLQLRRTSKELDVTRLLAQVSGPQRLLKDAMRRAHKKGHIDLKGTENRLRRNFTTQRCCLTHQGSLALELHSQAVIAMTRAKRSRSLPVSIVFPTALQAALIQAIQLFPEGALIKEVRAALPSEVRMVTVPSALMRLCRRGWVSLEKSADGENGRYKLTNEGQRVWRAMMRSFSGHS